MGATRPCTQGRKDGKGSLLFRSAVMLRPPEALLLDWKVFSPGLQPNVWDTVDPLGARRRALSLVGEMLGREQDLPPGSWGSQVLVDLGAVVKGIASRLSAILSVGGRGVQRVATRVHGVHRRDSRTVDDLRVLDSLVLGLPRGLGVRLRWPLPWSQALRGT